MTKVDVVSGFLGAGKTTLIKKLLAEALKGEQVVLIENEFGEIGVDGGFLKEAGVQIREMNSGCICCSLVGDFAEALEEVIHTYRPDRIIIEPSGVGKLSDVTRAVANAVQGEDVVLGSAVTVVDANKCKMYLKNFGEFFKNQVENAGTVLLSRTGNISEEKLAECLELLRGLNSQALIITTPWDQLTGAQILAEIEKRADLAADLLKELAAQEDDDDDDECCCHDHHHHHGDDDEDEDEHEHHHHHHHHHHHDADEIFTSWGYETPAVFTKERLETILSALNSETYGTVLRSKGMVASENSGEWLYFDIVPGECDIRTGAPQVTGRICVIGSELKEDLLAILFGRK